jgi:uncharacterized protein (TIGR00255 family)
MVRSMTGFGVADGPVAGGTLKIEIRSVNHRHFNAQIKTCRELVILEGELKDALRKQVERGHVSLSARWQEEPDRGQRLTIDPERAQEILDAVRVLKEQVEVEGEPDLAFLMRQPDVMRHESGEEVKATYDEIAPVLEAALGGLIGMRESEGASLQAELERVLASIMSNLDLVQNRAPERLTRERERLRKSVADLLDGADIDDARLSQELAFIADKLDITEEIVRLSTHVSACRSAMAESGAVGRKLSFLGQEMLREINTIGSKANDAEISSRVIDMKGDLEKFREQVENVE